MKGKSTGFFDFNNPKLWALVASVVSMAVYFNAIDNNYNIDDELVVENHAIKDIDFKKMDVSNYFVTVKNLFSEPYYKDPAGNKYEYRPMVMLSFFHEFLLFGKKPWVSHLINVLLYAFTCALIFYLLQWLFPSHPARLLLSFIITLFFAVHPIHTEAVASIKSRDELLSLLFGIASWIFALKFADLKSFKQELKYHSLLSFSGELIRALVTANKKSYVFYTLYLLFFLAALFSKQTTITFSILIPASIVLFRKISALKYLALIIPIVFLAAAFAPIYLLLKKVALYAGTMLFLLALYGFVAWRDRIIALKEKSATSIKIFFTSKVNYKWIAASAGVLVILLLGAYFILKPDEGTDGIARTRFDVNDRLHDFNELQLTPFLQQAAPTVIPIAGRKLNFVETPLVYVHETDKIIGTSLYALGFYLRLMFVPHPLSFYYGYNQIPITGFNNAFVIVSLLVYSAMFVVLFYLLLKRRHTIAAFGLLYFLVAMIPLSNLLTPIAGVVAERLSYSASLGFCIVFCYCLFYPLMNEKARFFSQTGSKAVRLAWFFFIPIILLFAVLTINRNNDWEGHLTLFRADIGHLDQSARAHHLYGSWLAYSTVGNTRSPESVQRLQQAVPHFKKALEIAPDFPYAWYDLAKTYVLMGDHPNAINAYIKSTQMDTLVAAPFFELGVMLTESKRYPEAEAAYLNAIEIDSLFMQAYTNLSYLYYILGRFDESIAINKLAIQRKPGAYEPLVNLGKTYVALNQNDNALYYFEKAVAINRADPGLLTAIANIYRSKGDTAKEQYYRNLK